MFEILRKSFKTGIVTSTYPETPLEASPGSRGKPEIDWEKNRDIRPAAVVCPTGAISYQDINAERTAQLDLGKCIFCGLCAEVSESIRITSQVECAARL